MSAAGSTEASASAAGVMALLPRLLPALGITRLADQTGLDRLGIPVMAAVRPNSRSVAVHQGKGLDQAAAKVSAVMEAAECFHAEHCALPLRLGTAGEVEGAVPPDRLPHLRDPVSARFLWTQGEDLLAGGTAWVPYELVHADYTAPQPADSYLFVATTNGLGAGLSADQAQSHALCELIERDAVALWRAAGGPHGPAGRAIAPDSVTDPACRALLARCVALDVGVAIWAVESRTGLPVFVALLMPGEEELPGIEPEIGAGCHPSAGVALRRALLEAAQSRVTRIAGARDDFPPESYDTAARDERLDQAQAWFAAAGAGAGFEPGPERTGRDVVLDGLARGGCGSAVWVDLARPGLPIAVGRAVVPGLAGPSPG